MRGVGNGGGGVRVLVPRIRRRVVTYGAREGSDFQILAGETTHGERPVSHFGVHYRGRSLGEFSLLVPVVHNVLNATAAIAGRVGLDIRPEDISAGLGTFRGGER